MDLFFTHENVDFAGCDSIQGGSCKLMGIPLLENALLIRRKRRLLWLAWSSAIIIGSIAMSGSAYYYYFGHNT